MKAHFIGIGGIGMSALAQLLLSQGVEISGSDPSENGMTRRLRTQGAKIYSGHQAANIQKPDLVVYSSSIPPYNPELNEARRQGIPVIHRGQMLARLVAPYQTIAVAGAHGKSTTSALAAQLLVEAGLDPTAVVGAELEFLDGNVRAGKGRHAVVEADESDGSLLWLSPAVAIITNLDEEHLDFFRNLGEILETDEIFLDRVSARGTIIGCADDSNLRRLLRAPARRKQVITYGFSSGAEIIADQIELRAGGSRFRCARAGKSLGPVELKVPGRHNVLNSLAIVALAQALDIPFQQVQSVLGRYEGVKRRFQIQGEMDGVLIVEDYGHHPTEIQATLEAARSWQDRRIRCVFQPHRYTRTRYLLKQFSHCFEAADEVILLPLYAASEDPVEGIGSEVLLKILQADGKKQNSSLRSVEETIDYLIATGRPGDLVIFMGAGSVGTQARSLAQKLGQQPLKKVAM